MSKPRILTLTESDEDRFDEKVTYSLSPTACWEWNGSRDGFGYGMFRIGGKIERAHRIAFAMANNFIMPDGVVMHRCDNPPCVRASHLQLGTRTENNADRDSKGRHVALRGEHHGMAKLNEDQVREIRQARGYGICKELAQRFGVSLGTVYNIRSKTSLWGGVR